MMLMVMVIVMVMVVAVAAAMVAEHVAISCNCWRGAIRRPGETRTLHAVLWPNAMCFHSISGEGRQQPHESHMICNAEGREPHKYDTMMIMMLLMLPMLMIVTMITIVILIV
jgi:hypothetical protein